jgi:hypothetical protein
MNHRVGIIFSGARADHQIFSPRMSADDASREFRAVRKMREDGGEITRPWAHIPAGTIIAVHLIEDDGASTDGHSHAQQHE